MALPQVKALSFLMDQGEDQQYEQLPYEGITLEEFEKRKNAINESVDWSTYGGSDGQDSKFCDGDVCVI